MRKALSGRAAVSALGGGGGKAAGGGAKAAKRASGARAAGDRDASTSPHPEDRGGSPSAEAAAPVMLNARGEPVVVAPSGGRLRALSLRPPRGSRVAQPSLPSLDAAEQALASLDKDARRMRPSLEEARQLEELIEHTLREQQDDAKQPRQGFRRPSVHKGPKIELLGRSRSPSPGGAGSHEVVRNRSQERQLKPSSTLVVPQQTSGKRLSGTPTSDELLHEAPELQSGEEADAPASPRLATPSASSSASSAALAAPEDSSPAPQAAPDTQRREKAAAKRKAGAAAAKRLRPEGSLPTAGRTAPEAAAAAPRQPGEAPDAPSPAPAGRSSLARAASASPASQETPGGGDGPAVAEDADLAAPAAGGSDAEAASPPVPRVPSAVGADSPASTSEASAEEEEAIPTIQGTKVELVPKEPVTSPKAMLSKFQNAVRMVQQEKAKKRQLTLDVFREIVKERSRQQLMALSCKDLREETQKMNEYSEELQKSILQMTGKGPPKVRVNAKHEANESLFKEAAALQRDLMELRDNYHKLRKTKRVEDAPQPQVQRAATLAAPAAQRQPRVSAASSVSMDFSGLPQPGAAAPSTAAKTFQSVQRRMSLAMRLNKKVI
ncbi:unnamed protein product [Prorocentrum cordatum]|uniref:Uncharacterized protein n=1 Tax=Prorocentrum cordatum TaxID=2364126 RepID=A0ABN9XJV3_9DINO|nr:unnamed protein product [Polarella glacialis]